MELTVLARFPKLILDRAAAGGLDRAALEQAAGLVESDLADPDARISKSKLLALWREVSQRVPDPLLGLQLGSSLRTREMGLVGYIMAASRNLGHALDCLSRYSRILADDIQVTIRPDGETVDYEVCAPVALVALEHPIVSRVAAILAITREITETNLRPIRVLLPPATPPDTAPYRAYFQSPVQFQAGTATMTLASRDLDLPIPSADRGLRNYLEDYALGILQSLPTKDSLVSHIWRILMIRLPAGDPGIITISDTLGLNVRTVQRRLKEEGTTYRDLLDSFRRTTARQLLGTPRIPIKEIAFLLGYQDLGAFYRAFRRWEGCPPTDYRKKHVKD